MRGVSNGARWYKQGTGEMRETDVKGVALVCVTRELAPTTAKSVEKPELDGS